MNYPEYREMIENVPYLQKMNFQLAIMWLHPSTLPQGLVSFDEEENRIIKVPNEIINEYGNKVPVIAISKIAFAGHDKITDVVLPSSIGRIPGGAFAGCTELRRITIPGNVKVIREGTFDGCVNLTDVYYEGSREDWKKVEIVHQKHEIEFGGLIPGTPVHEIKEERLTHIPGNDALLTCNIHFNCSFSESDKNPVFKVIAGGKDITYSFRTM